MDTTTSVATTVAVVAAGRWVQDKPITINMAVGAGVLIIGLSFLDNVNSDLATKFALAILLTAVLTYAIPIARKLGFTK